MNSGTCVDVPSRNNLPPTFMCTCVGDFTGQQCESKLGRYFFGSAFDYNYKILNDSKISLITLVFHMPEGC